VGCKIPLAVFKSPLAGSPKFHFTESGKGAVSNTVELKVIKVPVQVELWVMESMICAPALSMDMIEMKKRMYKKRFIY
jgi:hypothetical protein